MMRSIEFDETVWIHHEFKNSKTWTFEIILYSSKMIKIQQISSISKLTFN